MLPLATRNAARVRALLRTCPGFLLIVALATTASRAAAIEVGVEVSPAGELFPALELSQAAKADGDGGSGLLRVRLSGMRRAGQARVRIDTPGLLAPAVIDVDLDAGVERVLRPRLDWDAQALRALGGVRGQVLEVVVERAGAEPLVRRVDVRVHPLDEALYFVRDGDARIDLGFMFAAWVDPQSPVVDDLLALARDVDPRFPELAHSREERLRQVRAVWMALERRGLRYADEGAGVSQGPVIYSQRVRLLADTWEQRVANCLDGSVLIASALERLGIRTMLVLVPGHAFIGFHVDDDSRHAEFLETTLLGRRLRAGVDGDGGHDGAGEAAVRFEAARQAGRARYRRASARLDGRHRPNYAVIDISIARSYGIMPLAVGRAGSLVPPTTSAASAVFHD